MLKLNNPIKIEVIVNTSQQTAWRCYTTPKHIVNWNFASPDWCCPTASLELEPGGWFNYRMQAVDGSVGFDFSGVFDQVEPNTLVAYRMLDIGLKNIPETNWPKSRKVVVEFELVSKNQTRVVVSFEPETQNPIEMQRAGWQAILDNFKLEAER